MKIIHIIGHSKSGKTTLAKGLISYFSSRGKKVGSIKSIHREGLAIDKKGSNTYEHRKSGAQPVCSITSQEICFFFEPEMEYMNIVEIFNLLKTEILIIEGMKERALRCVVCARDKDDAAEISRGKNVLLYSGVFSSEGIRKFNGVPVMHTVDEIEKIAVRLFSEEG